ncbi:Clavaminate synthase-like protein [Tilletiaria anomala UBC 951]|uniref:Clavaminate synthase-like protein n=1 Tax=Tilletiaria anomala (strain ATCC 24038 / CBS 436.72 / UBC 951) TaxID=1037660 RepID=A0A066VQE8_TILAU|nr:Clavaminate synthase-like protein [Tilletiaria anomala UBC 951]KDN40795.1 Clavaminate synthase-like protein [Tilletiaria anomala UBC 951]
MALPAGGFAGPDPGFDLSANPSFTLDYKQWVSPQATPESRAAFVTSLRDTVVGLGFFYLKDSPLEEEGRKQNMFELSERFFALSLEQRMKIDIENSRHFRGYSKFGDERTQSRVDHRDQIDYATHDAPFSTDVSAQTPFLNLRGTNQYLPDIVLDGHERMVTDWFARCDELSFQLTVAIEQALGLEKGALTSFVSSTELDSHSESGGKVAELKSLPGVTQGKALQYARMKMIRYPLGELVDGIKRTVDSANANISTQGVGAHKDGGWLTLLATSRVGGLQVQDLSGRWLNVPHNEGSIVVNFGQQFEVVTQGLMPAATHRVLSNTPEQIALGADRLSIAYFSMPALNAIMKPLPQESFGKEVREAYARAQERWGSDEPVSDVVRKDLHAPLEPFGIIAWRGITRSHPGVVARWHQGVPT